MGSIRRPGRGSLAVLVLLVVAAGPAAAREPGEHSRERLNEDHVGYAEYQSYCASCHGVWADGQGLLVPVLTVRPTNLRTLNQRYGDPLPKPTVMEYIDGRRPVLSHGSREMPVWGRRLYEDNPIATPDMRRRAVIFAIADYLESIQDPMPAAAGGR